MMQKQEGFYILFIFVKEKSQVFSVYLTSYNYSCSVN